MQVDGCSASPCETSGLLLHSWFNGLSLLFLYDSRQYENYTWASVMCPVWAHNRSSLQKRKKLRHESTHWVCILLHTITVFHILGKLVVFFFLATEVLILSSFVVDSNVNDMTYNNKGNENAWHSILTIENEYMCSENAEC
jgi:hypothetical protein